MLAVPRQYENRQLDEGFWSRRSIGSWLGPCPPTAVPVGVRSALVGRGSAGVLGEIFSGEPFVPAHEPAPALGPGGNGCSSPLLLWGEHPEPGHHAGKARGSRTLSQRVSHPTVATARGSLRRTALPWDGAWRCPRHPDCCSWPWDAGAGFCGLGCSGAM